MPTDPAVKLLLHQMEVDRRTMITMICFLICVLVVKVIALIRDWRKDAD